MPLERIKIQKWYGSTNRTIGDQGRDAGTRKKTPRFGEGFESNQKQFRSILGRTSKTLRDRR